MGTIVEFPRRTAEPDPQPEQVIMRRTVQLSLARNARALTSSLANLDESVRKADALICHIDNAEVRARLRLTSESIHSELLNATKKLLDLADVCQKKSNV